MIVSMKPNPEEIELHGSLVVQHDGTVEPDKVQKRISCLLESSLTEIGTLPSEWYTLYREPRDGRLWELFFPNGELRGAGPTAIRVIAKAEAVKRYPHLSGDLL